MRVARFFRGMLGTSISWAVAWIPFAVVPIALMTAYGPLPPTRLLALIVVRQALVGAIAGAAFATVLLIAGRRKRFSNLSMRWIALCGAAGGAVFPLVVQSLVVSQVGLPLLAVVWSTVTSAAVGATCASVSLALARRAPTQLGMRTSGELGAGAA